jgi:hypothetical protein
MPSTTVNGKRFTFPQGTTVEQMGDALDEYFTANPPLDLNQFNPGDFDTSHGQMQPQPARPEPGFLDQVKGVAEAGAAMATGATGGVIGSVGGTVEQAAKEIYSGEFGSPQAAERIAANAMARSEQLTRTPKTELGIKRTQQVGEALAPLAAISPMAAEIGAIGQGVRAAAPILKAKLVKSIPGRNNQAVDYLNAHLGGGDAPKPAIQSQNVDNYAPRFESKKMGEVRQSIKEGTVDSVGFKLKQGRVVRDQVQRDLLKKGVSEKVLVSRNNMTPADRLAASSMLDKAENFIRGVKGSETDLPNSVIGDNAMARFNTIVNFQDGAKNRITKAVARDLKGKPVDITDLVDNYIDDLSVLKIGLTEEGKLDFSNSIVTGPSKPITSAFRMIKNNSFDSADDLHLVKQSISNLINYDNKITEPIDARVQASLNNLREGINKKLRLMSDDYAAANDDYAKAAKVLQPFAKEMGKRFDPESDRVGDFVGQELRKTITNYAKANDLITAIDDLDVMARELGGNFTDDIMTQVMLNSELERVFGSFKPGSHQGVIEKGTEVALSRFGLAGDVAKAGLNAAKDRIRFSPPSKDKIELIKQLKQLMKE